MQSRTCTTSARRTAEQTGLIKPLTRWVLEESLAMRSRLLEQGYTLNLSVNISPNNLRERDFPVFVQRLMSNHSHHGAITLEVTETSMMQDPANSVEALRSLVTDLATEAGDRVIVKTTTEMCHSLG